MDSIESTENKHKVNNLKFAYEVFSFKNNITFLLIYISEVQGAARISVHTLQLK